jgi:hypothetical protein
MSDRPALVHRSRRRTDWPVEVDPVERPSPPFYELASADMPNKHNDARRHHIPKMTFKVANW